MLFAHPQLLWGLLIIIPIIAWYIYHHSTRQATLSISTLAPFSKIGNSYKAIGMHLLFALKLLLLAVLIILIARPQKRDSWSDSTTYGVDIVLAIDLSTSMLARDFKPDRVEAAKKVAAQFVSGRESDNIGLVIFAGESFTAVPMTTDKAVLVNYINDLNTGMLQDGTAIGDGLATAINRIKDGKAKSKSIILLTDGSNNTGNVAPMTAAEIAKMNGIKVYTIGVGKNGDAPYPTQDQFGRVSYMTLPVLIDETTLQSIANSTGGKYFRATDNSVLNNIFKEIDNLEKTKIDVQSYSHTEDDYMPWALGALILALSYIFARLTIFRTIP